MGVSAYRSGVTGQRKGNTDGSAKTETELHSQSPENNIHREKFNEYHLNRMDGEGGVSHVIYSNNIRLL